MGCVRLVSSPFQTYWGSIIFILQFPLIQFVHKLLHYDSVVVQSFGQFMRLCLVRFLHLIDVPKANQTDNDGKANRGDKRGDSVSVHDNLLSEIFYNKYNISIDICQGVW
nr:MAG TPA: hypothetical protein [Caudoviricetes sp.]